MKPSLAIAIALIALNYPPVSASAVAIPTVPVGDAGNAPDSTGFGAVAYDYRIGKTEVTNAQYVEFLNAKAAIDPFGLYNSAMQSEARGGIARSGVAGSFAYVAKANMDNKPVNYISWYDAIRFANWLENGQGDGDTETGAYTLLGGTRVPTNEESIARNAGAAWFLPSEDESYKAAYYQPAAKGGDVDDYWTYPTRSNSAPKVASAGPAGVIANPGLNVANYNLGADWNGQNGNFTTVGSAGPLSDGFYGTRDQAGNAWEWNEALIGGLSEVARGLRGGSLLNDSSYLRAANRNYTSAQGESILVGFRVATIAVPEPSTYSLAAIGVVALLVCKRRKQ